jgi:hypothetical protein
MPAMMPNCVSSAGNDWAWAVETRANDNVAARRMAFIAVT